MNKKSKSKAMWIPKILIESMHPKEKSKLASKLAYPKASSNSTSSTPSNSPSSRPSILGPYIPKSTSTPPSKSPNSKATSLPQPHHTSRCVKMMIFPTFPSSHLQVFHYPTSIFHPSIPLIQPFA